MEQMVSNGVRSASPRPVATHHRSSRMAKSGFGSVMPGASNSVRIVTVPLPSSCAEHTILNRGALQQVQA